LSPRSNDPQPEPGPDAPLSRDLRAAAAARRDTLIAFTRDLVAIATENPPGRLYRDCVERIAAELRTFGATPRILEVPRGDAGGGGSAGGRGNRGGGLTAAGKIAGIPGASEYESAAHPRYCLLAELGPGGPAFYLHGHYDVVPATAGDQFTPRVEQGRLYGRGSADMKSGLAAMVHAMGALHDCGLPRQGRVVLVAVPDEETGGGLGAEWLGRSGLLERGAAGAIVGEPTSGQIWIGHRGAFSLRITVHGRGAHGILQHEGVNAFEGMLQVARELQMLKAEVERRETALPIEPEAARRSILMIGGECSSGYTFNTVPARASFTIDRRTNPEEDFEAEKRRLLALIDHLRGQGVEIDLEVLQEGESSSTDADSDLVRTLSGAVEAVTGAAPRLTLCPGLVESRFYRRLGVPALTYGPGLLELAHSPREYVEVAQLVDAAAIYALTVARTAA
jgi:acetylornithine deacetylase/succinyl-diaminopimelate desuccinylase family protein